MTSETLKKEHVTFLNECPQEVRNVFLKIGLGVLQSPQDRSKVLEKVSNELDLERSKLVEIIAIYVQIIKFFLKTKPKEFCDLLLQFGFSSVFVKELPLISHKEEVEQTIRKSYNTEKRSLVNLKWRIDLSLHNEFSNKNAKSVIIQINLSNERQTTLKIDLKTFHRLRYNISLILKEIAKLKEMLA